jgi:hypothetical protein
MPTTKERSKEEVEQIVRRHTNDVTGYPEVTQEMRTNIVSLVLMHGVRDEYPIEKMAKMFAEPIYYLRKSLEHQMDIDADSLVGATPQQLKQAQLNRDRVEEKLMNQVTRQIRFWNTFLNHID